MNKQQLEDEVSKLRALLVMSRNETTVAHEAVRQACTNNEYYVDQLKRNGDAWSKKYLELEEKSAKAIQTLDATHKRTLEDCLGIAKIHLEKARSETLAYAFEHVVSKLTPSGHIEGKLLETSKS